VEYVNGVIAALGVGVTIVVAWASTRTTRARRRAEEAQLALRLLEARREAAGAEGADRTLEVRLADTARFATVEFTRLMLDDGPRWWSILPVVGYGALLVVAAPFTPSPNGATVFIWIALLCFAFAGCAIWIKRRRARRLSDAGIHVASVSELIDAGRRDWTRVWSERRAARAAKTQPTATQPE